MHLFPCTFLIHSWVNLQVQNPRVWRAIVRKWILESHLTLRMNVQPSFCQNVKSSWLLQLPPKCSYREASHSHREYSTQGWFRIHGYISWGHYYVHNSLVIQSLPASAHTSLFQLDSGSHTGPDTGPKK